MRNRFTALFYLVRLPNLIIVALTQGLIYFGLLLPSLQRAGINPVLDGWLFFLLVLVTILITAGGYLFNDLMDGPMDRINRPEKVVIGIHLSRQNAYWLTYAAHLLAFIASLYLAFRTDNTHLIFIFPVAVGGLYLYSSALKKLPLLGNLLVAAYCAGVAGIIWLAEYSALAKLRIQDPYNYQRCLLVVSWFMVFAFLATLYREIIKDMEDYRGDKESGLFTLPIYLGMPTTKAVAFFVGMGLATFLVYAGINYSHLLSESLIYLGVALVMLPLVISFVILWG
ncbi:MAG: UbiA family prenyltransferase, partial [Fulvivirga sp.]|nr:UbiA family prenyltransferase [Fulvivirga sp.]